MTMNIAITGGTGFVGSQLLPKLRAAGHHARILGRRPIEGLPFYRWESPAAPPVEAFESCEAVVHLAGETVAQRWTESAKRRIFESRVEGTRKLVLTLTQAPLKPQVLIAASAVGIYGDRGGETLTESSPAGSGFLADVTSQWEAAALGVDPLGIRVVMLRFGVILGRDGGAFPKMSMPFRFGAGGRLGSGEQWIPWIHIDDIVNLIMFAIERDVLRGAVNATAPNPVTNAEFTRALAGVLHRPAFLHVPAFALKLALGEMAGALIASERAVPTAAERAGFQFRYPELEPALRDLKK